MHSPSQRVMLMGESVTRGSKVFEQVMVHSGQKSETEARSRRGAGACPKNLDATSNPPSQPVDVEPMVREQPAKSLATKRQDQMFRLITDSVTDLIAILDAQGRRIYNSPSYGLLFGEPGPQVGSDSFAEVHPDDREYVIRTFKETIATGFGRQACFRFLLNDGSIRYVESQGNFVRDAVDSEPYVVVVSRDVTERKQTEAALRAGEERLQRALEASRISLWDFDLASGRVYLSETWSELLGGPSVPTMTTFTALAALVPIEDQASVITAMTAALKEISPSYSVEHRIRRADGEIIWLLSKGRVVERDENNRALRAVGTNQDITERKQAEATRLGLEAQLQESQKMQAIGTLAGGIAHDFNNILGAILGNATLVDHDIGADHPAQKSLEQIKKSGLRARSLVQQILSFSRHEPPALVIQPLRPLIEGALELLRATLPAAVRLDTAISEQPLHGQVDATQIGQVLMNLCTNAWHALQDGNGQIRVGLEEVAFRDDAGQRQGGLPAGRYVRLWVSDTGRGMNETTRSRVFEPFFTTKPVHHGTGLGLAVCHGIIAAHQGAITVQSELGQGSRFDVYLPLLAPSAENAQIDSGVAKPPLGQGQNILYLDDDDVMLVMVERLLQRLGYRVTTHCNPHSALDAVRAQPHAFDLVVTDFNMPERSGLDVAKELARVLPNLPVVISSGYVTEKLRTDASRAGVRAVLNKEDTFDELGELLHRVLAQAAASDTEKRST